MSVKSEGLPKIVRSDEPFVALVDVVAHFMGISILNEIDDFLDDILFDLVQIDLLGVDFGDAIEEHSSMVFGVAFGENEDLVVFFLIYLSRTIIIK